MVIEKNKEKVLILGAKGNLGVQLVKIFRNQYDVTAWDREEIDITDKELISRKINDIKPDIIINTAAYNAVDKCEESEQEFALAKKLNGEAVGYLAEAAVKNNTLLVHYSTDYVFAGDKIGGYQDGDEPNPVNKYGESKLLGEQELISRSCKGLKWYLIRTSKLFGFKNESGMAKPSFFDIMIKLSQEKREIDVVDEEASCFTYTADLAKTTKELIESDQASPEYSRRRYGIYHIINSGPCTWYEAALELFKIAGIDIKVKPVTSDKFPRPAKRPKYSVLLNTKLEPLRDWQEALREYLRSNL